MMHLIIIMGLVLISLTEIYFSLIINSRSHFSPPVRSFVSSWLDILHVEIEENAEKPDTRCSRLFYYQSGIMY